jgi:hypothetical protein
MIISAADQSWRATRTLLQHDPVQPTVVRLRPSDASGNTTTDPDHARGPRDSTGKPALHRRQQRDLSPARPPLVSLSQGRQLPCVGPGAHQLWCVPIAAYLPVRSSRPARPRDRAQRHRADGDTISRARTSSSAGNHADRGESTSTLAKQDHGPRRQPAARRDRRGQRRDLASRTTSTASSRSSTRAAWRLRRRRRPGRGFSRFHGRYWRDAG